MKKITLLIILLASLVGFNQHSFASESYLCITEAAGGVKFNGFSHRFEGTAFDTTSNLEKFLVKREDNGFWRVRDFGSNLDNSISCRTYPSKPPVSTINCETIFGSFGFSVGNLRFYSVYTIPALADTKSYPTDKALKDILDHNTPMIGVGSCSKL